MNFGQLQTMVLEDGFGEAKRDHAKEWINGAYQRTWSLEQWGFKTGTDACTTLVGNRVLQGVTSDIGTVLGLQDEDGQELRGYQEPRAFYRRYGDEEDTGEPQAYTIIGLSEIRLGPVPDATYNLTLIYEKALTPLVDNSDTPAIPVGYHMAIVHGARAHGFRLLGIPLAASEEEAETNMLLAMRMEYLSPLRAELEQARAYRP